MHGKEEGERQPPLALGEVGWCHLPATYALVPFELKVSDRGTVNQRVISLNNKYIRGTLNLL